jgi:hypothetical protein
MQVDFAQPARRADKQLSLLVSNPLTVLVNGNEMTVEQNQSSLFFHRARC